jgi:hypothetical protein
MWLNALAFVHRLERRGYERLGDGLYSIVLAKPGSNKVVKVARCLDDWPRYIAWASMRGELGNKAPLVTSLKVMRQSEPDCWGNPAHFYVAVMERLSATLTQHRAAAEGAASAEALKLYRAFLGCRTYPDGWQGYMDELRRTFAHLDLHGGNWMLRLDGSMVLTDPLSTSLSTPEEVARIKSPARPSLAMAA